MRHVSIPISTCISSAFKTSNKNTSKPMDEDQLKKIFMRFDADGDRVLSREEIRNAFEYLGAMFPGFRANRGISCADANGDGRVDMTELDDLVRYVYGLGYTVK